MRQRSTETVTFNSEKDINELKTTRLTETHWVYALERDQRRGRQRGGLGIEGEDLEHRRRGVPTARLAQHNQIHFLGPPDPRPRTSPDPASTHHPPSGFAVQRRTKPSLENRVRGREENRVSLLSYFLTTLCINTTGYRY